MTVVLSFDVGVRNLAYALCEFSEHSLVRIIDWDVVDVIAAAGSKAKTKSIGIAKAVDFLLRHLVTKLPEWQEHNIDKVVVEQQLARASLLKTLQFTLYTFGKLMFPSASVSICHAKHKLKVDVSKYCNDGECFVPTQSRRSTTAAATKKQAASREKARQYRENKQRCTWMAERVIRTIADDAQSERSLQAFADTKKKDDLADCLIQALVVDAGL